MRILSTTIVLAVAASAQAGLQYDDATFDTFTNGDANVDIVSVSVSNTDTHITFTVETRGYASWTKYLFFLNSGAADQTGTNAWNRPLDMNGQTIDHFIGSWVDAGTDNSQLWSFTGAWGQDSTFTNDQSDTGNNRVSWTTTLESLGLGIGDSLLFDVGTSGGGKFDTTVDLLSRSDQATDWWTNAATSGEFLKYDIVPTPGAVALLGLAGAFARRRRAA